MFSDKNIQAVPPVYTTQPGQPQVAPQQVHMGVVSQTGAPRLFYSSITCRYGRYFIYLFIYLLTYYYKLYKSTHTT